MKRLRTHTSIALFIALAAGAADVDTSRLPAANTGQIEFGRDIRPLFESACTKCHGFERPKSGFQLISRDTALRGGKKGVAIIPGNSSGSPLIHYVAGLVTDMEMPPSGKGEPLTPVQIALLRGWIDQGALWPEVAAATNATPQFVFTPTLRWISVTGNEGKFRELEWTHGGWAGSAEATVQTELKDGVHLALNVRRAADQGDYLVKLSLERPESWFVHTGFEQYRKYDSDTGGYYAGFATPSFSLGRDIYMDLGKAWFEFGLVRPDWPRMVLGYEYHYRDGTEATLHWGSSTQGGETRKIYPGTEDVDERVHVLRFDLVKEWPGTRLEDSFRGEFYDLKTSQRDVSTYTAVGAAPTAFSVVDQRARHFVGANALRIERQFNDWLMASGGYLYSRLSGDASFAQSTVNATGGMVNGDYWSSRQIILERESHVFNINTLLGPWKDLTLSAGLQNEWTGQRGLANASLDSGDPNLGPLATVQPAILEDKQQKRTFDENVALRYTGIPSMVIFAEGRFQQEVAGKFEQETGTPPDLARDFVRDTDSDTDMKSVHGGFTISPWPQASLTSTVEHRVNRNNYNHVIDQTTTFLPALSGTGYPAFIRQRDTRTDEVEAKLTLRPVRWLKTRFSYKLSATDYYTVTDSYTPFGLNIAPGGQIYAGNQDAHIFSANAVLTPVGRMYFSGLFSYSPSRTSLKVNNSPSVAPYRGDVFSVQSSCNYVLSEMADLALGYSFSRADFSQGNQASGLPLGILYERHGVEVGLVKRIKQDITLQLKYGYFRYDEPSSGHVNDYRAHAVFASLSLALP